MSERCDGETVIDLANIKSEQIPWDQTQMTITISAKIVVNDRTYVLADLTTGQTNVASAVAAKVSEVLDADSGCDVNPPGQTISMSSPAVEKRRRLNWI